jgi:hypothetical protein
MNSPCQNSPCQNSLSSWVSPSNVTIMLLVGFLFVGHGSDWKLLHGRSSSERPAAGSSHGFALRASPPHDRRFDTPSGESGTGPNSFVADSRPQTHDGKSRREID